MATTNGGQGSGVPAGAGAQAAEKSPQLHVVAQYIKDFSFENPNAPKSFAPSQQPNIGMQINVNAQPMAENEIEVELKMEGKAETPGLLLFRFELSYAGIFRVQNIPQENMGPLALIECPRLLFPFAREIIASASRNSGFPPFLIEPVDFVALFRQKAAEQAQQAAAGKA